MIYFAVFSKIKMRTYIVFYNLLVVLWSVINNVINELFTFGIHNI